MLLICYYIDKQFRYKLPLIHTPTTIISHPTPTRIVCMHELIKNIFFQMFRFSLENGLRSGLELVRE